MDADDAREREGAGQSTVTAGSRRRLVGALAALAVILTVAALVVVWLGRDSSDDGAGTAIPTDAAQGAPAMQLWGLGDGPLQCGSPFVAEPGVVVHDAGYMYDGSATAPGERPIAETGAIVSASADASGGWDWRIDAELSELATVAATSIAVQGDVIVGIAPVEVVDGQLESLTATGLPVAAAGMCGESEGAVQDGEYTVHFVVQILDAGGNLIRATVVDPADALVMDASAGA